MAKNIDNSYDGAPDFTSGLSRTNPQAHIAQNGVQLYGIRKIGGGTYAPTWTYAITSAGATTTFTGTAGTDTTGLRYMKWRIIDEDGNTAFGTLNVASPAAVAVTTSGLDPKKKWRVEFTAEVRTGGKSDIVEWWLEFPAGYALDNPTGSGQNI